jgi:hypothetical protein
VNNVARGTLEVRPVGVDGFAEVHPLLVEFCNPQMSANDWRRMLFDYHWSADTQRGFVLYSDATPVGFMGTIFSERRIDGRAERFCNASSWIVREAFRTASILLIKSLLSIRDCTITNFTPNDRAYDIFAKVGFKDLEREQLWFFPAPSTFLGLASGSFTADAGVLETRLGVDERQIYRDLRTVQHAKHILLRSRNEQCYLVATPIHRRQLTFAHLHYIGNPDLFFRNQALALAAMTRAMGAAGFVLDARFAQGYRLGPTVRKPYRRLYRPARATITPRVIDTLYSEQMVLD